MTTVRSITFSPTGSTQRIAKTMARAISDVYTDTDLTQSDFAGLNCAEDLAVIAMPVYAGRVPAVAMERLKLIEGSGKRAICVVVYGNRAYEDALLELTDTCQAAGFKVIGAAAVVARHSVIPAIAETRPDARDLQNLEAFARVAVSKPQNDAKLQLPGNRPYREVKPSGVVPVVSDACVGCRRCALHCPVKAVSFEDPHQTDSQKCILCMRCVHRCPVGARALPQPVQEALTAKLSAVADVVRENEFFLF